MLRFYKAVAVEMPIWVDGQRTNDKESRITLLFVEEKSNRGINHLQWGSALADKALTMEEVLEMYDVAEDLTGEFKMIEKKDSEFMRVVPC